MSPAVPPPENIRLGLILLAIEEVTAFYTQAMQAIFYPEDPLADKGELDVRAILDELAKINAQAGLMMAPDIESIRKLYEELSNQVGYFIDGSRRNQVLSAQSFAELGLMFEELMRRLRHLQIDQYQAGAGFDSASGLRSADVLIPELKRELEHVARRGSTFSLVMIKLDFADTLCVQLGGKFVDVLKFVGAHIKDTMRVFDDAYRLKKDLFVLSLKHTDQLGVKSYVQRMIEGVKLRPLIIDHEKIEVSFSFCSAQPTQDQSIEEVLRQMENDIGKMSHDTPEKVEILSEQDISPLQRYLQEQAGRA